MPKKYRNYKGFENITTAGNLGAFDASRFQYEVADEIGLDTKRLSQQKVNQLESNVHNEGGFSQGHGAGAQVSTSTGTSPTGTTTRTMTGAGGQAGRKSAGSTSGAGKKTSPKS